MSPGTPYPSSQPSLPRALAAPEHRRALIAALALLAAFTLLRLAFAVQMPLRVDEAYYWTWSKESVASFLDHPPMIAWAIELGTAMFGDTNLGVRFSGLVAMAAMQFLLADIVWQATRRPRYALLAALLPDAALDYGMLMAKVAPDTALIPFALAVAWALVRLATSGDLRWWLAAGLFAGCAALSKYTAVLMAPAIAAYVLVPAWRMTHLRSAYFWCAPVVALAVFAPVLIWNAQHDWASFAFQLARPANPPSAKFFWDYVGLQFGLIGIVLMPVVLTGAVMLGVRGLRDRDGVAILIGLCVIVPLTVFALQSIRIRIGDSWPLFVWPFAFAGAAINLQRWRASRPSSRIAARAPATLVAAAITGWLFVLGGIAYYLGPFGNLIGDKDPYGKEAGFADVVAAATQDFRATGAQGFVTTDYRIYSQLRWHLRDSVPVMQANERNRFIGFARDARLPDMPRRLLYIYGDARPAIWAKTPAQFTPVGTVPLTWRGVRYDTYATELLTNWTPVWAPPAGDPFFVGIPH